jgi:hypothetical protein
MVNAQGFDTCLHMTTTQLQDFWTGTPLFMFGTYLGGAGGSQVGCTPLSVSTITAAANQGWGIAPFWFGPQMGGGCSLGTTWNSVISLNTATAYSQGVGQANSASSAASAYGYTLDDLVYYDLEAFNNASGCLAAAKSFINGWDHQMQLNTPYRAGVYGSECASYLSSMASIANVPNAIAPADQVHGASGATASVYGLACISNGLWSQHQRLRQYEDPPSQVYWSFNGSGSIPLDAECADVDVNNSQGNSTITANNCEYRY